MIKILGKSMRRACTLLALQRNREIGIGASFATSPIHNKIINFTSHDDFVKKVFVESENPVIVVFNAAWIEPCKKITKTLENEVAERKDLSLAIVSVEDNVDAVETFEIKAVPALLTVNNGIVVNRIVGNVDTNLIKKLLQQTIDLNHVKKITASVDSVK